LRLLAVLLFSIACHAQIMQQVVMVTPQSSAPTGITIDSHCMTDNGGAGSTVTCTLTTVSAGDTILVGGVGRVGTALTITDSNSQTYTPIYFTTDSANPSVSGMSYTANAAAGSTTVQVVIAGITSPFATIFAAALHGTATTSPLDSTFSSGFNFTSTSGTASNGNCSSDTSPTTRTPSAANEIVFSFGAFDSPSGSVGANFTILDNDGPGNDLLQYWIQTTATATTGAFVSTPDDWSVGCAAFHS
jgi:hypothetical protein